jgi:hypothetical protein
MFNLEELYGVSRKDYCTITGITPDELIRHLEAEVDMLQKSHTEISILYRESALSSAKLKYFEKLCYAIEKKIDSKSRKIQSLRNFG